MAITRVQGNARGTGTGTSISVTLASAPINGNVLVAAIGLSSDDYFNPMVSSITQTGVTWTQQIFEKFATEGLQLNNEIWFGVVSAGASTSITVNLSASCTSGVVDICEYSGVATSGFLDKTAVAYNIWGTNPLTGTTITTTVANELWIGNTCCHSKSQTTPLNGFALLDGATSGASVAYLEKIVSSVGTANSGTTASGLQSWVGCIATFKGLVVVIPTVTTEAVSNIEEITATGNGTITVTGGENCTKRGVCWNTTGTPTISDPKTEEIGSFGTGAFTESMTSLSPGTLYYVRAYAYNLIGYGYGSQVTFTTKPNPPTSLASTAKTKNSISLSWSKGSGAVTTMIRYRTDQYPTGPTDGTQGYSDTGSSGTVGSLSSGQIYYFRAWSYNSASPSPGYSDDYSSVTEYTRPDDPSSLACTVIDSHEIDLSWSKGTGGDKVMIRRKIGSYPTSVSDGDQAYFDTGTSYHNTGLVGGVHYYYRAWAYDTDSGYYSDNYSQDEDTTTTPTLLTGKIFTVDKDNNVFRINSSDLTEEKALSIT